MLKTDIKILLIKPPEPHNSNQKPCIMPPVGLWQLREYLQSAGHEVIICDEHAGDNIDDYKGHYSIIGLSIQFSIQHQEYKRLVKKCRSWTDSLIVGGVHAANVEPLPGVDYVIAGPGEEFFSKLLNIPMRYGNPIFTETEIQRYWKHGRPHDLQTVTSKWMSFTASYGCNLRCGFCGINNYWGSLKYLKITEIEAKLKWLKEAGIKELLIEDDNIAFNYRLFIAIIYLFKKYGFKWSTPNGIYVKTLIKYPGIIPMMKECGCWRVSLPFETGNIESATYMNTAGKFCEYEEALQLVNSLKDNGIKTNGFFIIGYPGETIENINETLQYANDLPLDQRGIYIATPYPGTGLYEECKREGYLKFDGEQLYNKLMYNKCLINTPEWTAEEIDHIRQADRDEAIKRAAY